MMLQSEEELVNTREKLDELQHRYDELSLDMTENPRVRELTMTSLKRLINQLTEEIARYECRQTAGR